MIKKKLAALIAALLVCAMLFPTAAFAYTEETEDTTAETTIEETADTQEIRVDIQTADEEADEDEALTGEETAFSLDMDLFSALLSGMDPEILEVLKEHPRLIAMFLPTLHVTVREGSVTIAYDTGNEMEDSGQTGTVSTGGSNLNVRTGAGTDNDIITQLTNGSSVNVLSEQDGWYRIEIPAQYGYVCGEYLKVNDIPSTQADDGYSFDIDGNMIMSFLEMFMDFSEDAESVVPSSTSYGLTPDGNLTLVDDYGERTGEGQQFITLVTKAGNYFYLVIDRDDKGEENVHFLNFVDERDLFALMEEEEVKEYQSEQAAIEASREAEEQAASQEQSTEDPEHGTTSSSGNQETEKKSTNMLPILLIVLVMAGVGAGWFLMQTKKKKKTSSAPDPDADYNDDDEDYAAGSECPYIRDKEAAGGEDPYEDEILNDGEDADDSEDL